MLYVQGMKVLQRAHRPSDEEDEAWLLDDAHARPATAPAHPSLPSPPSLPPSLPSLPSLPPSLPPLPALSLT